MKRRDFIITALVAGASVSSLATLLNAAPNNAKTNQKDPKKTLMNTHEESTTTISWKKTKQEWQALLTAEQFHVLREEGTEAPFSSALNDEKRRGGFHCAGCDFELFKAEMKFDSGTGWPSFFDTIPEHIETKTDFKLIYPRKEYHCARCGGHQGHIFKDGPKPTGLRYCNNGVALRFREVLA